MDGSSGDDVGRAASSATCVLRWRNGLIAAAVVLSCALRGVSAEDEQLLVPEVVFEEPEESETTGIAYSPQSGVLYEVGTRLTDIDTGDLLTRHDRFIRGIELASNEDTFFLIDGTEDKKDQWADVTTDGANGLVFAVGQVYNGDVEESSELWFNARALDEASGET
ncbi:unnamed protein product, partial [Ectocarpus sp. 12 AP-2014]